MTTLSYHCFRPFGWIFVLLSFCLTIHAQRFEVYDSKIYPSKNTADNELFHQLEMLTQDTLELTFKDYTPLPDTTKIISKCDEVDYIHKIKKFWWWTVDTVKAPVKMVYEWKVYQKHDTRITRIRGFVCDTDEDDDYYKDVLKRAKALAKASRKRIDNYFKSIP